MKLLLQISSRDSKEMRVQSSSISLFFLTFYLVYEICNTIEKWSIVICRPLLLILHLLNILEIYFPIFHFANCSMHSSLTLSLVCDIIPNISDITASCCFFAVISASVSSLAALSASSFAFRERYASCSL